MDCFWEDVGSWLSVFREKNITLTNFNKLFGFPHFEDFTILLNWLLLNARFIIYRSKYTKLTPNSREFISTIKEAKNVEYVIAKRSGDMKKLNNKWKHLSPA